MSGKEFSFQWKRYRFNPWVGKIPWRWGLATHSCILAWRIPWTEEPGEGYIVHGITESWTLFKWMWKGYILHDSNDMTFWKRQNYGDSENISDCQGLGERKRDEQVDHRGFSEQWSSSVWKHGGEYRSLDMRPNPQNVHHHEWALTPTMDCEWWRVKVGSLPVTDVPSGGGCWWWGRLCMCGGQGVMWNLCSCFSNLLWMQSCSKK